MKGPHLASPSPEEEKLCVLYDPATGRIAHSHRVTTMPGGRKVNREEMEGRTRERASSRGRDINGLAILHVDPKTYKLGAFYQIDVRAKKLVETTDKPAVRHQRERR